MRASSTPRLPECAGHCCSRLPAPKTAESMPVEELLCYWKLAYRRTAELLFAVLVVSVLSGSAALAADDEKTPPKATDIPPDVVVPKEAPVEPILDERQTFKWEGFSFSIKPPKGFDHKMEPSPFGAIFAWSSQPQPDGHRAGMLVQALPIQSSEMSADEVSKRYLEEGERRGKLTSTSGTITIAGRQCRSIQFKREMSSGAMSGTIYVLSVQPGYFIMMTQDRDENKPSLDFLKSSMATFETELAAPVPVAKEPVKDDTQKANP